MTIRGGRVWLKLVCSRSTPGGVWSARGPSDGRSCWYEAYTFGKARNSLTPDAEDVNVKRGDGNAPDKVQAKE